MVKRALTLLTSILIALPLLMPFNIYGAGETQIVPTYTSSTTQQKWQTKIRITNYCEGTNASTASCKLSFYVTGNYYGIINVDGYDSSNTHWMNGTSIFIADGYGEYNYNFYQNGIKEINRISIWGVSLVQPDSNVDLTQIISLLTSINQYEQSSNTILGTIQTNTATAITEIRNVLTRLVQTNGYLDTLTKLRQWNLPIESFVYNYYFIRQFDTVTLYNGYYEYPIYNVPSGGKIPLTYRSNVINQEFYCIFGINKNIWDLSSLNSYFSSVDNCEITDVKVVNRIDTYITVPFTIVKLTVKNLSNNTGVYRFGTFNQDVYIMPIFLNEKSYKNISTDFALRYGLTNSYLDNINKIANGTTASQSAAQSSDSANSQLQTESNTLFQQENGFKSDMQSAMQNVNNTFRLQDMGTKFVSSAQWVRSQYESFTNNTPFASLITFSLITGLALILLGKVYK